MRQTLRPYQSVAVDSTHQSFREGYKKTLLCMPTGSGKTTVVAHLIEDYLSQDLKILFVAHRRELVDQAHNRLAQHGIDAGLILPGYEMNGHKVNIASVQTLVRREIPQVDVLIVDECHHSMAGSFLKIIGKCIDNGSRVLGLTATPFRLDGKPLGLIFDDLLVPTTVRELIDDGYLVQPRYFGARRTDLEGMKVVAGEYSIEQMYQKFDKKVLYDGIISNYVEHGGEKCVIFNVNIEHSTKTRDAFREAGFTAEHIDAITNDYTREDLLKRFRNNEFEILCNCQLFTEGFDLPHLDTVIVNRRTKSLCLYTQMIGRVLRPIEGKEHGIVIDQGNNIYEHGFVEDEQDYDLHRQKKKGDGIAPIKLCPQCQSALHASVMKCGFCGYIYPKEEMELEEAVFEEIKESPKICKKAKLPEHLRKPWGRMNNEELQEVATLRGYKKGWVWMQLNLQTKRRKSYASAV